MFYLMAAIILTNLVFCVHYQEERDFIGCCQPASQDPGPPTPPAEGVKILLNTSRRISLGFKDPHLQMDVLRGIPQGEGGLGVAACNNLVQVQVI